MRRTSAGRIATSQRRQFWVRAEYLYWWVQGNRLPPLVTTSPNDTPSDAVGILGNDQTTILFGNESVDEQSRSGGRLRFGYVFGCEDEFSLEADLIGIGDGGGTHFAAPFPVRASILARPIIDAATGQEDAQLVAFPELSDGQIDVRTSSELYSAAASLRRNWFVGESSRWDLLAGYRYFRYREGLTFDEQMISRELGSLIQVGTQIDVRDQFKTTNDFHGCELGLSCTLDRGPWSLDLLTKVALGNVHQVIEIDGRTQVTTPGDPPTLRAGGLLALPSNMGSVSRNQFAVLPEWGIHVTRKATEHLSLTIGYDWLLLTNTVRTGDQIDRTVDRSQLSPFLNGTAAAAAAARPANPFHQTTMLAHGVNAGIQFTY